MISKEAIRRMDRRQSPLIVLRSVVPADVWQEFWSSINGLEAQVLRYEWDLYARRPQRQPEGAWNTWLILAGRGFGKTRPGSETVIRWAQELGKDYGAGHIALMAKDPADARDVMVEGESGILACSPPWFRPRYEPTKRRLTWDNGVHATIYSSETPDDLRGPQHHKGWGDEPCKWKHPQEMWDMYQMGARLGDNPQTILTTTPRPIKMLLEIIADPGTVVTTGKTDDNAANLSPQFLKTVYRKYKGTRLGRQELDAELLKDTPGALWTMEQIDALRVKEAPDQAILVVGIDPGVTDPKGDPELMETTAETGIVIAGKGSDGHLYVHHDFSGHHSANEWGTKSVVHYDAMRADRIVGEANNGGDLVEFVVQTAARDLGLEINFKKVHASRGKHTRAEPVSALYEQRRAHHVGMFPELEDQMTTWTPGQKSPDRMDALVWAATEAVLAGPDELILE